MIEVKPYFKRTDGHKTVLLVSPKVRKAIDEHVRLTTHLRFTFAQALRRWCENGFGNYEGGKGFPIKEEWENIYRLGAKDLFRVYGFYPEDAKSEFVALDAFVKNGTRVNAAERKRINQNVRDIRDSEQWQKTQA